MDWKNNKEGIYTLLLATEGETTKYMYKGTKKKKGINVTSHGILSLFKLLHLPIFFMFRPFC
jgi:hypothetical protein